MPPAVYDNEHLLIKFMIFPFYFEDKVVEKNLLLSLAALLYLHSEVKYYRKDEKRQQALMELFFH